MSCLIYIKKYSCLLFLGKKKNHYFILGWFFSIERKLAFETTNILKRDSKEFWHFLDSRLFYALSLFFSSIRMRKAFFSFLLVCEHSEVPRERKLWVWMFLGNVREGHFTRIQFCSKVVETELFNNHLKVLK